MSKINLEDLIKCLYHQVFLKYRKCSSTFYRIQFPNGLLLYLIEKENFLTGKKDISLEIHIEPGFTWISYPNIKIDMNRIKAIDVEDSINIQIQGFLEGLNQNN